MKKNELYGTYQFGEKSHKLPKNTTRHLLLGHTFCKTGDSLESIWPSDTSGSEAGWKSENARDEPTGRPSETGRCSRQIDFWHVMDLWDSRLVIDQKSSLIPQLTFVHAIANRKMLTRPKSSVGRSVTGTSRNVGEHRHRTISCRVPCSRREAIAFAGGEGVLFDRALHHNRVIAQHQTDSDVGPSGNKKYLRHVCLEWCQLG